MVYAIVDWQRYEPKPRSDGRGKSGPLSYFMWPVRGFDLSRGYRKLCEVAGHDSLAAMGVFSKLCELAADQPRGFRDGTIRNGRNGKAATLEDIAFFLNVDPEDLERPLSHLTHPDVKWVEYRDLDEPGKADCQQLPTIANNCAQPSTIARNVHCEQPLAIVDQVTKLELELETQTGTRTGDHQEGSSSDSASVESVPHQGVRYEALSQLSEAFGVSSPVRRMDSSPRAKQDRSDYTTLARIVGHVITAVEKADAKKQKDSLLDLARKATDKTNPKSKPIAWFVSQAKQKWPGCLGANGNVIMEGGIPWIQD